MRTLDGWGKHIFAGGTALAMLASLDTAHAGRFRVLYSFAGGSDGAYPEAGLIKDLAGNLYGTTTGGGISYGYGTVFELAPDGIETVLYAFTGGSDGNDPYAGLIRDSAGNLYGTTAFGGARHYGTVFELAPDGTETVLHSFTGSDGADPFAGLIKDKAGNLYGTTEEGGSTSCEGYGCGTVFELAPDGTETVLHAFTGGNDGDDPIGGLIKDSAGNLYGTTVNGGGTGCGYGCGTVFKLAPDGTETVLYAFTGGSDGAGPAAGLIKDSAGNLYGTTEGGGGTSCNSGYGCGTVFEFAPDGTETVLHAFTGGNDGATPFAGLIKDSAGNLYGTTFLGGTYGGGVVFKVAADGTETVLHAFTVKNGTNPFAGLIKDSAGNLYGTTSGGGNTSCNAPYGCGTVFRLKK
jgi:uncharacterized repeat protein (TIGR03803 family)